LTHHLAVRLGIALAAIITAVVIAKIVDRQLAKKTLAPGTVTRYRILRQSILWTIVFVGVLSALLVIPQVRGLAAGLLASSAVIGLVLGFAAQRTIGNFIAGLLIAFTQPIRLGDEIEFTGTRGIVEEVGLIYTWVRTPDDDHMVIPNEMLVSDTLKNSTIRNEQPLAQITVRIPLSADLRAAVTALEQHADAVIVTQLADQAAVVAVRRVVKAGERIEAVQSELRLEVSETLRAAGITGVAE
jgi:small conductance mechanosensitive channel